MNLYVLPMLMTQRNPEQFRNSYYSRIAVPVYMIATGTDIRPVGGAGDAF